MTIVLPKASTPPTSLPANWIDEKRANWAPSAAPALVSRRRPPSAPCFAGPGRLPGGRPGPGLGEEPSTRPGYRRDRNLMDGRFRPLTTDAARAGNAPSPLVEAESEELDVRLETELPQQLAVGRGTAMFLYGSCFHPGRRIAGLEILVENAAVPA